MADFKYGEHIIHGEDPADIERIRQELADFDAFNSLPESAQKRILKREAEVKAATEERLNERRKLVQRVKPNFSEHTRERVYELCRDDAVWPHSEHHESPEWQEIEDLVSHEESLQSTPELTIEDRDKMPIEQYRAVIEKETK